jgi:hypothetical protein
MGMDDKTISDRPMDDRTPRASDTPEREGGAWIGQHPDPNTEKVREDLDEGAERVSVTQNESGEGIREGAWPQGHREGDEAGDDDVRRAGENA